MLHGTQYTVNKKRLGRTAAAASEDPEQHCLDSNPQIPAGPAWRYRPPGLGLQARPQHSLSTAHPRCPLILPRYSTTLPSPGQMSTLVTPVPASPAGSGGTGSRRRGPRSKEQEEAMAFTNASRAKPASEQAAASRRLTPHDRSGLRVYQRGPCRHATMPPCHHGLRWAFGRTAVSRAATRRQDATRGPAVGRRDPQALFTASATQPVPGSPVRPQRHIWASPAPGQRARRSCPQASLRNAGA